MTNGEDALMAYIGSRGTGLGADSKRIQKCEDSCADQVSSIPFCHRRASYGFRLLISAVSAVAGKKGEMLARSSIAPNK